MSKLLRLYNSWDQYSCGDLEFKDEVRRQLFTFTHTHSDMKSARSAPNQTNSQQSTCYPLGHVVPYETLLVGPNALESPIVQVVE